MAEKNYGFFAGKISSVKKYMKENEVVRIDIDLITYRKKKDRWEEWDKIENLAILVSEKEQIQYLIKENASEGNMLSVRCCFQYSGHKGYTMSGMWADQPFFGQHDFYKAAFFRIVWITDRPGNYSPHKIASPGTGKIHSVKNIRKSYRYRIDK